MRPDPEIRPHHTGSYRTPEMDQVMPDDGFPEWAGVDRSDPAPDPVGGHYDRCTGCGAPSESCVCVK